MLQDTPLQDNIISTETVYHGFVWDVVKEDFTLGSDKISREFVKHTGAVAVLALNTNNEVFLIKQYRHPVRRKEWEIPAGLLDVKDEDPCTAAKRELWEEADLEAKKWNVLIDYYTTPGGNNEAIRIFLAQDVSEVKEKFARFDEEAHMETGWFPLEEVVEAIVQGRVHNPSLCLGIMTLEYHKKAGTLNQLQKPDVPFEIHIPSDKVIDH
ncbi:MAG: NUDIX hydrolase [Micrococcaceae bacterium]